MKKHYVLLICLTLLVLNLDAQSIKDNVKPLNYDAKSGQGKVVNNSSNVPVSTNKVLYLDEDWDTGVFPNGWTVSSGPASTITVGTQTWHENTSGNPGNCASVLYDNSVDVHDEWLVKGGITLPASGSVRLQFDYNTSNYWFISPYDNGDVTVNISIDGGVTWDTIWWEQNATYDTYVWTTEYFDLTTYLGQTIDIGIHYDGQDAAQFNIDNIRIYDVEGVDLGIQSHKHYFTGGSKIKYSKIPTAQAADMEFSVDVTNIGAESADSTVLSIVAGSYSANSDPINVMPSSPAVNITDNQGTFNLGTSGTLGMNNILYTLACDTIDNDLSDNSVVDSIEWTNHTYARDLGELDGWFAPFDDDGDMADDPMEFIGQFEINQMDTVYGIQAVFTDGTPVGQEMYYNLYSDDGAGGFIPFFDGTSVPVPSYTLTAADLTGTTAGSSTVWVNLPFPIPIQVDPAVSKDWFPVVGYAFGDGFHMAVSGDSPDTTNFLTVFASSAGQSNYFITSVPMIRISNNPNFAVGVNEQHLDWELGQNTPNPFSDYTVIPFTLKNPANVALMVTDVTGKVIENRNLGVLGAGSQNIEFNGSELASGIYYYTLNVDGRRSTKKFVVE